MDMMKIQKPNGEIIEAILIDSGLVVDSDTLGPDDVLDWQVVEASYEDFRALGFHGTCCRRLRIWRGFSPLRCRPAVICFSPRVPGVSVDRSWCGLRNSANQTIVITVEGRWVAMNSNESGFQIVETPLVEATVEIRFPGDARIDRFRGDFQLLNRDSYPQLFVPQVVPGQAPALQHYRFSTENQMSSVSLAVNSLAVTTREYPGWGLFKKRVLKLWGLINDEIGPKALTRIGVRFQNEFQSINSEMVRQSDSLVFLAALEDDPEEYSFKVVLKRDPKLRIEVTKDVESSAFLVDFDAFFLNRDPDSLSEDLDRLHEVVETEFLGMLSPVYMSRLVSEKEGEIDA